MDNETIAAIGTFVFFAVLIVGVGTLFLGMDKVDADKIGVKDRLGHVTGTMEPGFKWTGLFVGVTEYPMTVQKMKLDRIEAVDKGGQAVYANIAVNYKIKDKTIPIKLYQEVATTGNIETLVERLAIDEKIQESFKQVTVQYEALEVIEKRDEVRMKTIERIQELFPTEYFEIISITISNIDFAESFNAAIQLKKDNTQLALAAEEKVRQSTAEAQQKVEAARGEADSKRLTADAEAYALKVQREQITPLMVQRNWIDKWDGRLPTFMMGQGSSTDMILSDSLLNNAAFAEVEE